MDSEDKAGKAGAPFFSIIVPTYNASVTIERCVNSIIQQKFSDYEVIIKDADSKDETIKSIIKSTNYDKRFKLISQPDQGVYDAMNIGIQASRGSWIYFLGSDDYLIDNRVLEDVANYINNNTADLFYGNVNSPAYGENYDGEFDIEKILIKNVCHQCVFYNRLLFEKKGLYNLKYKVLGDWDFNLRCFLDSKVKKLHIPRRIAFYSPGGMSITTPDYIFDDDFKKLVIKYADKLPRSMIKNYYNTTWNYYFQLLKRKVFPAKIP